MSKYIVCVFDEKEKAYHGARALLELEDEGSVAIYESAIIAKQADGTVRVEDAEEEGPIGVFTGMFLGSLIGMFAGPAGMALGAVVGSTGGLIADASRAGVNDDFLMDVSAVLIPGKYAIVAEITEGWTVPLDTRIEDLGGVVFRKWRIDVEDAQIERDIEANKREMEELEEEWNHASDEAKEKIASKIADVEKKLQAFDDRIEAKADSMAKEIDAKIEKIDKQIAKASGDFKKKLEKARVDFKADYAQRSEKLKQAGHLAAEALK